MTPKLQHPVPDALLTRFGDITVSFTLLESLLQQLASSLIGQGQRVGQVVAVEVSFRNLLPLVENLFRERCGEEHKDFEDLRELLKRALAVNTRRNQLTHSVWAAGETAETITRIKTTARKGGLKFAWEYDVSESDLSDFADEIKSLGSDLQRYWIRLIEEGTVPNT